MEKEGKGRRKRKDPESRDFACLCGKSYLSYAAAYTHAKNKHDGDKQYIDGIKKPQREQLKRGRPKEKKHNTQTEETARLTLIESTILKICGLLQGAFTKCILQGNQQRDLNEYQRHFRSLSEQYLGDVPEFDLRWRDESFLNALVKDFSAEVAARVKLAIVMLCSDEESVEKGVSRLGEFAGLWRGRKGINEAIAGAFKKWRLIVVDISSASQHNQEPNGDYDI